MACSNKVPGCSDQETKELVMKIVKKEAIEQYGSILSDTTFSIESIRTVDVNKDTGACKCAADLIVKINGERNKLPITYTSTLSDNGDEFYVEVFGL
jgi:hypothetical protein